MKSSKRGDQSGNFGDKRKYGKSAGDKWTSRKLDRKSSRGMIYENEELRIRTININAEVERGQSDIRKLRRENEQLRREIWSLRDEYDRLNKLLKTTQKNNESSNCENDVNSESITEDSDSCDTCRENDIDECLDNISDSNKSNIREIPSTSTSYQQYQQKKPSELIKLQSSSSSSITSSPPPPPPPPKRISSITANQQQQKNLQNNYIINNENDNLTTQLKIDKYRNEKLQLTTENLQQQRDNNHMNFDHLSIVSEENLTNSSDGGGGGGGSGCNNSLIIEQKEFIDNNDIDNSIINNDTTIFSGNLINISSSLSSSLSPIYISSPTLCLSSFGQNQNFYHYNYHNNNNNNNNESSLNHNLSLIKCYGDNDNNIKNNNDYCLDDDIKNDLQSTPIIPPLSHFENIINEQFNHNAIDDSNYSTTTSTTQKTDETVLTANGWDFNIQSPFSKKKLINNESVKLLSSSSSLKSKKYDENIESIMIKNEKKYNQQQEQSPKHFFSPIKPQLRNINNKNSDIISPIISTNQTYDLIKSKHFDGPDICFANVLGSPYKMNQQQQEQILSRSTCNSPTNSFQNGGNLEELLMDIESLSKDIYQMELDKQQFQHHTQENILMQQHNVLYKNNDNNDDSYKNSIKNMNLLKNRKPYRSEMNLVLNYNGNNNPIITPIIKKSTSTTSLATLYNNNNNDEQQTDDNNKESIPNPMKLLPKNLQYLNFDNYNKTNHHIISPILHHQQQIPIHNSNLIDNNLIYKTKSPSSSSTSLLLYPSKCDILTTQKQLVTPTTIINHSPLKMRRNLIDDLQNVQQQQITENIDSICDRNTGSSSGGSLSIITTPTKPPTTTTINDQNTEIIIGNDGKSSSGTETTKRKTNRRVSIFNFQKNDDNNLVNDENCIEKKNTINNKIYLPLEKSLSINDLIQDNSIINNNNNSNSNLSTIDGQQNKKFINNDDIINGIEKNLVYYAPNSPQHSIGRRNNNNNNNNNSNSRRNHHHHHHHHHHQRGNRGGRKMSQDSSSPTIGNTNININNNSNKCSRRHSESTVLSIHQDSSEIDVNNRISLNDSHQDIIGGASVGVGGETSISDRNSNSLVSSRESSTSLSIRSQRRKISINSHNGGKIPWCGCWGNGCL